MAAPGEGMVEWFHINCWCEALLEGLGKTLESAAAGRYQAKGSTPPLVSDSRGDVIKALLARVGLLRN